jgi:hypothetical protein
VWECERVRDEIEGFMKGKGGVFELGWCKGVVKLKWGCEGVTRRVTRVVGGRERVEGGLIFAGERVVCGVGYSGWKSGEWGGER